MDDGQELVRQALKDTLAGTGRAAWCEHHNFSLQYVSDVLSGRRDVSPRLADALGYRRTYLLQGEEVQPAGAYHSIPSVLAPTVTMAAGCRCLAILRAYREDSKKTEHISHTAGVTHCIEKLEAKP